MVRIADRLKAEIQSRADVRAADVARHLGISNAAMSDILSGKTKQPKPENLLQIADFLGLEMRWIISGKGPKTKEETRRNMLDLSDLSHDDRARIQAVLDAFKKPTSTTNGNNH